MDKKYNANEFDYTIVLDSRYTGLVKKGNDQAAGSSETENEEAIATIEAIDRLYFDYERMCFKDPTVLDKDDIYPHTYQWRTGDRYDQGKKEALEEALKKGIRVADTDAYSKYVEEAKRRKFSPVSWD